jgi:hypothetical protein
MDKIKLTSNGKGMLLAAFVIAVLLAGGCETTKESSQGISSTAGASLDDTGNDNWNLWSLVKKADNWVSANLW